jgi:hypothetical protein
MDQKLVIKIMKNINQLHDAIWVFGSNLAGRHGKGFAKLCLNHHGAKMGVGEGFQGNSYALPTKDEKIQTLSLERVQNSVFLFLKTAEQYGDKTFYVTRIGCGLAGYQDSEILNLFPEQLPDNVILPAVWQSIRQSNKTFNLIVAGGRNFNNYALLKNKLDHFLSQVNLPITIISGNARGADTLGIQYAKNHGHNISHFPADWERFGKSAGYIRNQFMAWAGHALALFWDGQSKGSGHMFKLAQSEQLKVRSVVVDGSLLEK